VVFTTSVVSFERVFEVVDLPLDIVEKPNAIALQNVQGNLTFEGVSFDYNAISGGLLQDVERVGHAPSATPKAQPSETGEATPHHQARTQALTDISFSVRSGELVALVGPSGAGKTSMTYLIPRLYDPIAGRILIDGVDIRDVSLSSLASNIGMVTQETYLFNDTIGNNLRYAKQNATQAELEAAAKAANIHDFIMGLENGYDTLTGERGYRLSGAKNNASPLRG
jgi:ATP-binding cassette subfamily B protein